MGLGLVELQLEIDCCWFVDSPVRDFYFFFLGRFSEFFFWLSIIMGIMMLLYCKLG